LKTSRMGQVAEERLSEKMGELKLVVRIKKVIPATKLNVDLSRVQSLCLRSRRRNCRRK
jgi:hypothetical protein